jgi:hypothetical protein
MLREREERKSKKPQVGKCVGAKDRCERPSSELAPMNGTDMLLAKKISEICWQH